MWISPAADATVQAAERYGFTVELRRAVDVGGIAGELPAPRSPLESRVGQRLTETARSRQRPFADSAVQSRARDASFV